MQDHDMEDREIIRRILEGREDLYRNLVSRYRRDIHVRAHRILPRQMDVDDAVQETFVRAYFRLKDFRPDGNFRAWLYGFLRNIAGDAYRKAAKESSVSWDDVCEYMTELAEQPVEDPQESFHQLLKVCMETLSKKAKRLIRLRYVENKSSKHMGKLVQMTASAVNVALMRARLHLRHCIESRREAQA